ncbi:hypothetical protein BGZ75_007209 [Mortierella antarctica]|nr:hypothetical protein BGZ75_007209 [Mortierella antarctica]
MMHRHLILLSDKDDTDISEGGQESSDIDSPEVFTEDVPSLLTETMPENSIGDISFIIEKPVSCAGSDSETGSPASEYSSAKEEFFPDPFTSTIRTPSSPTDLPRTTPSPSVDPKETVGRHLMDLIIIRPTDKDPSRCLDEQTDTSQAAPSTSGDSSPWSDLCSDGQNHIVAVMQDNQVYSCWESSDNDNDGEGRGDRAISDAQPGDSEMEGTLGRCVTVGAGTGFAQDTAAQPGLVQLQGQDTLPSRVVKVVCSDRATFLMTENGDLWGWGTFKDTQGNAIGLIGNKTAPRPILICPQSVEDVVCGRNHVLILSNLGDVISWGANDRGQLGRQVNSLSSPNAQFASDLAPFFIAGLPSRILGIGAGKVCSFAWDKERLYGWGDNTFGQLGALPARSIRTRTQQDSGAPAPCQLEKDDGAIVSRPRGLSIHWKGKSIKQVQGGAQHTVILTFSGLVMTIGNNDFGQLGVSSPPSPSSSLPVSPQDSSGSDTSAISSPRETMHASGKKRERPGSPSSATSKSTVRLFPALVRIGQGVKEISCGDHHTATCGHGGEMYLWGQGYDGILSIHSSLGKQGRGHTSSGNVSPIPLALSSVRDRARKVVAVSTMRRGVSIALVSNSV